MKIAVTGTSAYLIKDDTLIQQSERSYTVTFAFDDSWDNYEKTAVFQTSSTTETVALVDDQCVIPSEVLEVGGVVLNIGVYGTVNGEDTDIVWCATSRVLYRVDIDVPSSGSSGGIKSGQLVDHVAEFYTTDDLSGTPAFTMDIPEEMFLDQARTRFVENFAWTAAAYPGSTDPDLDGKPVFVLAVKGEDPTENPAYSFVDMQTLIDTYSAAAGDGSTTVTVNGHAISVNVNLSSVTGNILAKDGNGALYALHQDISGKMDKPSSAVTDDIAVFDANQNAVDSGVALSRVPTKMTGNMYTPGHVLVSDSNGSFEDGGVFLSVLLQGETASDSTIGDMLDEVFPAGGE